MEPAIATLYYLAVLQGVVHCYIVFFIHIRRRMVKAVAVECSDREMDVLTKYLKETMFQCRNDPSLVTQRNLITQALDKIGSRSIVDCVSGVEILYTAISIVERKVKHCIKESYLFNEDDGILVFHNMMMKHLILSASSAHILQKLLEMLDSRAPHVKETRQQAAMIVDRLAFDIDLEQFPRGIQHISSLLGMFQPYHRDCLHDEFEKCWILQYRRRFPSQPGCAEDYGAYEKLFLQGLSIFRKIATDRNNCRVISDTPDLVSNIMVPITSDLLHNTPDDHGAWSDVVMKSLEVMSQLVVAPGEIGAKLRREISSSKEAVSTLQRILSCNKCNEELQQRAIQILTRIHMDSECNRREFVSTLVDVFTQDTKYISGIRGYAGCALSQICFNGGIGDAKIVIQTGGGDVVDSLTKVLIHEKNKICRQAAAEILEHLCTHYTKDDDEYLGKAMTNAIPQILGEILCWGDETHKGTTRNRCPILASRRTASASSDQFPLEREILPSKKHGRAAG
uniref:Uncharacterized protein n=1 Tax=Avena sativa TaxID=4498 RepID=A0ACD5V7W0_AVESA